MSTISNGPLNSLQKVEIIHAFSLGLNELIETVSGLTGEAIIEARKLVINIILEYFKDVKELKLTRGSLQKLWTSIPQYYNAQGCLESLESCKVESCYPRNPVCFSRKLSGQIENMAQYYYQKKQQSVENEL